MKFSILQRVVWTIGVALVVIGCGKSSSDKMDFGTLTDATYRNQYLGFSIELPKDWNVQDQKTQQRLMKRGIKAMAGDDDNLKAVIEASELKTVNLFAVFQHPIGSPVEFNPSVMSVAESVAEWPGIKRGKDYLFQARKMLEAGQMQIEFPRECYSVQLGGVEFDVMEIEMTVLGKIVKQKYYSMIRKGYALGFIISFTNEEEEALLQKILTTLSFGAKRT